MPYQIYWSRFYRALQCVSHSPFHRVRLWSRIISALELQSLVFWLKFILFPGWMQSFNLFLWGFASPGGSRFILNTVSDSCFTLSGKIPLLPFRGIIFIHSSAVVKISFSGFIELVHHSGFFSFVLLRSSDHKLMRTVAWLQQVCVGVYVCVQKGGCCLFVRLCIWSFHSSRFRKRIHNILALSQFPSDVCLSSLSLSLFHPFFCLRTLLRPPPPPHGCCYRNRPPLSGSSMLNASLCSDLLWHRLAESLGHVILISPFQSWIW